MASDEWRGRLAAALQQSGKSKRAVSIASGNAPGYLHGLLAEGKEPTINKLIDVCNAIPVSPVHILYGLDVRPEDHAILEALRRNPRAREGILALLSEQSPDPHK